LVARAAQAQAAHLRRERERGQQLKLRGLLAKPGVLLLKSVWLRQEGGFAPGAAIQVSRAKQPWLSG
jgi:hypothetical protein